MPLAAFLVCVSHTGVHHFNYATADFKLGQLVEKTGHLPWGP
jgi:hypothetical protein